ncbi:MAG: hypothetical protein ONB44_21560 [candidate division KSB1 bacterium]|nr:hypothetical protein [candidate division KSB1 bacterium]MDZ7304724.1 hypothetical protein [candidate division KSB1 bacterium]
MHAISFVKKIPKSKKITIPLPQFDPGQEVEILLFANPLSKHPDARAFDFDMEAWAKKWACNLGDEIRSTDVESFTGRAF